ncbi:MAG: N-acetylmuramoyl-L-alanine amidase [Ignavibacteria bacterium]|nr:N-acetylmuramoyl-L-alanine amidase [Ignavibacteria bacterium]
MKKYIFVLVLLLAANFSFAQKFAQVNNELERCARIYNIPVDILKSVAWAESHFYHHVPTETTGHNGKPNSYGVMGLRNDDWFGYSLKTGADLIGKSVFDVINNYQDNIAAGAAYLSSLASKKGIKTSDLNAWKAVLEEYSGIPQADIKEFYSFDCFAVLEKGVSMDGAEIMAHPEINMNAFSEKVRPSNVLKNIESDDYPSAVWSSTPNFTSGSINQLFAVVHDTEGGFAGSLSWLQNPSAQASAHYIIRSSDGYIAQLVKESDRAWHVRCWNPYMLGVEHEGYVDNPAYFTEAMYLSSAALFKHFVQKFNIPVDRNHIIGHDQWTNTAWKNYMVSNYSNIDATCNSHTDPGPNWDWDFYMQLVSGDTAAPSIVSWDPANPSDSVWANSTIKITFNQRMKPSETIPAISITPSVQFNYTWLDNYRTLALTPKSILSLGTTYQVSVAQSAKNYNGISLRAAKTFSFVTRTSSPYSFVSSYPAAGAQNISPSVKLMATFNAPLMESSFSGNVYLTDSVGNVQSLTDMFYVENNGKGTIICVPKNKLTLGKSYKFLLKAGLKSIVGATLGIDQIIPFRATYQAQTIGTVVDNMEAIGNWKQPSYSGSTVGVDSTSSFSIVNEEVFDGSMAGKLAVIFTRNDGICREFNATKPVVGNLPANSNRKVGFWIHGDCSNNIIEYWFYYNSSTNAMVTADTINWTGWKLVEVPLSKITATGDIILHSIVIRRTSIGAVNTTIYIDDLQWRDVNGVQNAPQAGKPTNLVLEQNYPNPFNPSTIIAYSVPTAGNVSLRVYDILGNEVAVLVNQFVQAGSYRTELDFTRMGKNVASGIYFYKLQTPSGIITRKMNFLK